MRIEFDGNRMRLEPKSAPNGGYMIVRDGKLYSVALKDGQPMVLDVGAMMQMLGPTLRQAAPPQALDDVGEFRSMNPLRRTEVIAGITGDLHELVYTTRDGTEKRTEIVLASEPRLIELSSAMMAMGNAMQQAFGDKSTPGSEALERQLRDNGKGILRFGDEYRLVSLAGPTPAAARFELPAAPMAMPSFPGMPGMPGMGSGAPAAASGAQSAGAPAAAPATGFSLPDLFGSKADRQKSRAEDKVGSEVDAAGDRAVDKAIERAFGRLLGR
jgi:hypothetical protein